MSNFMCQSYASIQPSILDNTTPFALAHFTPVRQPRSGRHPALPKIHSVRELILNLSTICLEIWNHYFANTKLQSTTYWCWSLFCDRQCKSKKDSKMCLQKNIKFKYTFHVRSTQINWVFLHYIRNIHFQLNQFYQFYIPHMQEIIRAVFRV